MDGGFGGVDSHENYLVSTKIFFNKLHLPSTSSSLVDAGVDVESLIDESLVDESLVDEPLEFFVEDFDLARLAPEVIFYWAR